MPESICSVWNDSTIRLLDFQDARPLPKKRQRAFNPTSREHLRTFATNYMNSGKEKGSGAPPRTGIPVRAPEDDDC